MRFLAGVGPPSYQGNRRGHGQNFREVKPSMTKQEALRGLNHGQLVDAVRGFLTRTHGVEMQLFGYKLAIPPKHIDTPPNSQGLTINHVVVELDDVLAEVKRRVAQ